MEHKQENVYRTLFTNYNISNIQIGILIVSSSLPFEQLPHEEVAAFDSMEMPAASAASISVPHMESFKEEEIRCTAVQLLYAVNQVILPNCN